MLNTRRNCQTLAVKKMRFDPKKIKALPSLIFIDDVHDALLCSRPVGNRFLQTYNIQRIKIDGKNYVQKKDLLKVLKENQAQPIHTIEA